MYGLNAAGRALLHQECASRRMSHVTSGDKAFMTFWHDDWATRKSSEVKASSESSGTQLIPSRSAPELPAAALQAQESPSGALSNKSMRSTTSGGDVQCLRADTSVCWVWAAGTYVAKPKLVFRLTSHARVSKRKIVSPLTFCRERFSFLFCFHAFMSDACHVKHDHI